MVPLLTFFKQSFLLFGLDLSNLCRLDDIFLVLGRSLGDDCFEALSVMVMCMFEEPIDQFCLSTTHHEPVFSQETTKLRDGHGVQFFKGMIRDFGP